MAITISTNADVVRGLFSSASSISNSWFGSTDMLGINYTDYASIKSGAYGKLLRAYYDINRTEANTNTNKTENKVEDNKENTSSTINTNTSTSTSTSTSTVATEKLAAIESSAEKVKSASDVLLEQGSNSVFNKTAVKDDKGNIVTDKDGNTVTDYNKEKIYSSVKDFVDQYNTMMTNASDASVSSIKSTASALKYQTLMYEDELASVGITINKENNTLSIDEKSFKNADVSDVKEIFNGTNSFSYKVAESASTIDKYAAHEASKANTYTNSGKYTNNSNIGEIFNSII